MTASSPLAVLLLQITTILIIAKLTAALVARAGQPAVVGEMLGGILIGVHAIFGAFLAGVVVSANDGVRKLVEARVYAFASAMLVPLFFASAGLRTELSLLGDARSWLICAAIIAVAVAGKLGGGAFAARWTGMAWRDAAALGVLMNTRGLMELIVLNVGYDLGILSPALFSMMVVMALVTTAMTAPLVGVLRVGNEANTTIGARTAS